MGKRKQRGPERTWTWWRWKDKHFVISPCSSLDGALAASYAAFVSGEAYTDYIETPDEVRIQHALPTGDPADDGRPDQLSAAWEEWLERNPERRVQWDVVSRRDVVSRIPRLTELESRHAMHPRPFTPESIVANPNWYRHLYGIFGMSDDQFEMFLEAMQAATDEKSQSRARATGRQK